MRIADAPIEGRSPAGVCSLRERAVARSQSVNGRDIGTVPAPFVRAPSTRAPGGGWSISLGRFGDPGCKSRCEPPFRLGADGISRSSWFLAAETSATRTDGEPDQPRAQDWSAPRRAVAVPAFCDTRGLRRLRAPAPPIRLW